MRCSSASPSSARRSCSPGRAEALQLDVSQGLALAVLALIAVLPEYAVDFTFAAKAGDDPEKYAPLALANMTGANRLLIGIGLVAGGAHRGVARSSGSPSAQGYDGRDRHRGAPRPPARDRDRVPRARHPLLPHAAAQDTTSRSVDAARPGRRSSSLYAIRISRAPAEEPHLVGPAELIGSLPEHATPRRGRVAARLRRRASSSCAPSRSPKSLVETGESFGIDTFLLVQWLAPLASEAPELLVAGLFAWRLNTNGGARHARVVEGQPVDAARRLAADRVRHLGRARSSGLPLDTLQREELFLTAAQSAFAVAVLIEPQHQRAGGARAARPVPRTVRARRRAARRACAAASASGSASLYLVLAVGVLWNQRRYVRPLLRDGFRAPAAELVREDSAPRLNPPAFVAVGHNRVMHQAADEAPINRTAIVRGAAVGLVLIIPITILGAILDRTLDDFEDSGLAGLPRDPDRGGVRRRRMGRGPDVALPAHQRRARGCECVRRLDPGAHPHLGAARRAPRARVGLRAGAQARPGLRPARARHRDRHARRLPRRPAPAPRPRVSGADWFASARFGLFVHWGPYSARGLEPSWPLVGGSPVFPHCQDRRVADYYAGHDGWVPPEGAPRRVGAGGAGRRHAVRGAHHQAPRRLHAVPVRAQRVRDRGERAAAATSCASSSTRAAPRGCASASTSP